MGTERAGTTPCPVRRGGGFRAAPGPHPPRRPWPMGRAGGRHRCWGVKASPPRALTPTLQPPLGKLAPETEKATCSLGQVVVGSPSSAHTSPPPNPQDPARQCPYQGLTSWREEPPAETTVFASPSLKTERACTHTRSPIELCQKRNSFCNKRKRVIGRHTLTSK